MRTLERPETRPTPAETGWQSHIAQAHVAEPEYHLPGGISGTMKELIADPSATTRSLRSAQAVMHALYTITGVDETSRRRMQSRVVRERMGIVLDIFRPKDRGQMSAEEVERVAEKSAKSMIETAAVIWKRGQSNLGPIVMR